MILSDGENLIPKEHSHWLRNVKLHIINKRNTLAKSYYTEKYVQAFARVGNLAPGGAARPRRLCVEVRGVDITSGHFRR